MRLTETTTMASAAHRVVARCALCSALVLASACTGAKDRYSDAGPPDANFAREVPADDAVYAQINRAIVSLDGGACTGILIAPRLVLTSARCGDGGGTVGTGIDAGDPLETIDAIEIEYPGFCAGEDCGPETNQIDLALWVLARPPVHALPFWWHATAYRAGFLSPEGVEDEWNATHFSFAEGRLRRASCAVSGFEEAVPGPGERLSLECQTAVRGAGGPIFDYRSRLIGILGEPETMRGVPLDSCDPDPDRCMSDEDYVEWIEDWIAQYRARLVVGRFDADPPADVLYLNGQGHDSIISYGGPVRDGAEISSVLLPRCASGYLVFDVNADGRDDLFCQGTRESSIFYAENGRFPEAPDVLAYGVGCRGSFEHGDFNRDGYADLICVYTTKDQFDRSIRLHTQDRATPFSSTPTHPDPNLWCGQQLFVDAFDEHVGDELLCWDNGGQDLYLREARSDGSFEAVEDHSRWSWYPCHPDATLVAASLDLDTRRDLLCIDEGDSSIDPPRLASIRTFISIGGDMPFGDEADEEIPSYVFCVGEPLERSVVDVDGDFYSDLVCYDPRTGQVHVDVMNHRSGMPSFGDTNVRLPDIPTGLWP
jgi:hypothetical protein